MFDSYKPSDVKTLLDNAETVMNTYFIKLDLPLNAATIIDNIKSGDLDAISREEASYGWIALSRSIGDANFHMLKGLLGGIYFVRSITEDPDFLSNSSDISSSISSDWKSDKVTTAVAGE